MCSCCALCALLSVPLVFGTLICQSMVFIHTNAVRALAPPRAPLSGALETPPGLQRALLRTFSGAAAAAHEWTTPDHTSCPKPNRPQVQQVRAGSQEARKRVLDTLYLGD